MGGRSPKPLLLALTVLGLGCAHAHRLVPAAGAAVEPGNARVVEQSAEGVRLRVDPSAWRAGTVRDALRPVEVQIDNGGGRPLRIAYSQFALRLGQGFQAQALPPFQVAVQNASAAYGPEYGWGGFWGWDARFHHPGSPVWFGTGVYGPWYPAGEVYGPPGALPDRTVLRRALQEGVVDPGGHAAGFLYFADQPKGEAVTLIANLVDATTDQRFGTIEIPFTVQ